METRKARQPAILRPRIQIDADFSIGPGKIFLLRKVAERQSISGAARELGMTYKRAWMLIDTLNRGFGQPVVTTAAGGRNGGGAAVTPLGQRLLERYGALEARINETAAAELAALLELKSD